MSDQLLLKDALAQLDGHALLSPVEGRWITPKQLYDKLSKELPGFLDSPVRLTVDSLRYVGLSGKSVGGWTVRLLDEDLPVDKTTQPAILQAGG